jgi:hypothetical protein
MISESLKPIIEYSCIEKDYSNGSLPVKFWELSVAVLAPAVVIFPTTPKPD